MKENIIFNFDQILFSGFFTGKKAEIYGLLGRGILNITGNDTDEICDISHIIQWHLLHKNPHKWTLKANQQKLITLSCQSCNNPLSAIVHFCEDLKNTDFWGLANSFSALIYKNGEIISEKTISFEDL